MELLPLSAPNNAQPCMSVQHYPSHSVMRFHPDLWDFFHPNQLVDRISAWENAAIGDYFRIPTSMRSTPDFLEVETEKLLDGYIPLTDIAQLALGQDEKTLVFLRICDALNTLHRNGFYIGLLLPNLIYVHPQSFEVLLDVQPYPSGVPFVNDLIGDYPLSLFSRFTRSLYITRVADFYALGMLLLFLFTETFSIQNLDDSRLPFVHSRLARRLVHEPESFLFLEDISNVLREELQLSQIPVSLNMRTTCDYLHPIDPPISLESQRIFRRFLRGHGKQMIGVVCEDESTRMDVIRQHISEVLELDFFITVTCRDFPFATLREMIERTMYNAQKYATATSFRKARNLYRQLDKLLRMHYHGDDVVFSLADWLYAFCREILPAFHFQHLYYAFDDVQNFDEDSLRVFQQFWKQYRGQIPQLHIIITGNALPKQYPGDSLYHLEIGGFQHGIYGRMVKSQFAGVDSVFISELSTWLMRAKTPYSHLQIVLEHLIQEGHIQLSSDGWHLSNSGLPTLDSNQLLTARIQNLSMAELHLLRTLACLPSPVRARRMFLANGRNVVELCAHIERLHRLSLIHAYHDNSIFVPVEVTDIVQQMTTHGGMKAAYVEALNLQRTYRPYAFPPLIALSRLAGDTWHEYYYTTRYYREIRSALSYERKKFQLENIIRLQGSLGRTNTICWRRLLCDTYHKLNQIAEAGVIAHDLFVQTRDIKDRMRWLLMSMFQNNLDTRSTQVELLEYLEDTHNPVRNRVRAACWLARSNFFLPLQRDGADRLHRFYHDQVYANSAQLSVRMFAEFTIDYTIVMFQYFPDREEVAMVLLDMLESVLADSPHRDMMSLLYDAYVFQSNVRISRKYTLKLLETSRRSGSKTKEQVCHLNGMELSLWQGDVGSYRMHKERAVLVDEIRRTDLREQYVLHQLNYAVEWEQWTEFDELDARLRNSDVNASTLTWWRVFQLYASVCRGHSLPNRSDWDEENHFTLFMDALYALQDGDVNQAINFFQRSINAHGYHLTAGWSYRKLIHLLLEQESSEAQTWLDNFEKYLKQYSHDVFWPDYYKLTALLCIKNDEHQQAILYLRRALNGYQMIEKPDAVRRVEEQLLSLMEPYYVTADSPIHQDPAGKRLIEDRSRFLNQSLDLLIVIQLCEHVTESLDLMSTCERLTDALFEYFPVTRADITFDLYHKKNTYSYTSSGVFTAQEENLSTHSAPDVKYTFELYRQNRQSMQLDVYVQNPTETHWKHMAHFLSVIRPHLSNTIHYLEMMIDNLTGFYQRRYFLERLKEEFDLSQQYGLDLSLIMLDIDNFRSVNNFGHPEGDKVLRELSEIVRAVLRKNDIPGRYGGEEILLILPKTDGQAALRLAEKLRGEIEEEFAEGRPYKVTISVGVSSLKLCSADSIDELISFADDAEIQAKASGKNQVVASWQTLAFTTEGALQSV